jgi:predicted dinucleotide-binding enzyme
MRIGILGSGLMGGKLGKVFARAGHDVVFSYAREQRQTQEAGGGAAPSATPFFPPIGADIRISIRAVRISWGLRELRGGFFMG